MAHHRPFRSEAAVLQPRRGSANHARCLGQPRSPSSPCSRWLLMGDSARTFTTASACSQSTCRRCASGAATSLFWSSPSSRQYIRLKKKSGRLGGHSTAEGTSLAKQHSRTEKPAGTITPLRKTASCAQSICHPTGVVSRRPLAPVCAARYSCRRASTTMPCNE